MAEVESVMFATSSLFDIAPKTIALAIEPGSSPAFAVVPSPRGVPVAPTCSRRLASSFSSSSLPCSSSPGLKCLPPFALGPNSFFLRICFFVILLSGMSGTFDSCNSDFLIVFADAADTAAAADSCSELFGTN